MTIEFLFSTALPKTLFKVGSRITGYFLMHIPQVVVLQQVTMHLRILQHSHLEICLIDYLFKVCEIYRKSCPESPSFCLISSSFCLIFQRY